MSVGDGARHRAGVGQRSERAHRSVGNTPESGLEPDDTGERARDADRSATVGAKGQGGHTCSESRGASPARTAGRHRQVPGVPRDTGERVVGEALPAELRSGGLPDEDCACLPQPGHRRGFVGPILVRIGEPGAAQHGPAADGEEVLDRHRDAVERAPRLPGGIAGFRVASLFHRFVHSEVAERIDGGVTRLDSRQ